MELNEFRILKGKTSSNGQTTTITGASVGRCARLVSASVTSSGENGLISSHSVDGTIGHVVSHDTSALSVLHNKVKCKVLNEEDAVVTECPTEEGVKHRVSSPVSDGAAAIGLATLTPVSRLTSKGSLINFAILSPAERHAIRLELKNCIGCLLCHVVNSVLVTKPVTALHCVVEVPPPIICVHVTKCGIDTTLN